MVWLVQVSAGCGWHPPAPRFLDVQKAERPPTAELQRRRVQGEVAAVALAAVLAFAIRLAVAVWA